MSTPFAALEQRLNSAVLQRTCNATVDFGAGELPAIFDDAAAVGNVGIGMVTSQPSLQMLTASVPANPVEQTVTVRGNTYVVAMHEPDGSGWSRLLLESA